MKDCLFLSCFRWKQHHQTIISSLQKKEYILTFLKELVEDTDNQVDNILIEFVENKLFQEKKK